MLYSRFMEGYEQKDESWNGLQCISEITGFLSGSGAVTCAIAAGCQLVRDKLYCRSELDNLAEFVQFMLTKSVFSG